MYGLRKKYQKNSNNDIKEIKEIKTTVIETKIEKPTPRRVEEQRVVVQKETLPKNRYGRMQQPTGRSSAIINLKRDNDIIIKTKTRDNSNEKDKRQNKDRGSDTNSLNKSTNYSSKPYFRWSVAEQRFEKEPTQWKNYERNKDEKPVEKKENNIGFYVSKVVNEQKNEKTQKTPNVVNTSITRTTIISDNKNKPEEKVVKTQVSIVETKKETPKTNEYKVSYKRTSKNEEKTDDNKNDVKEDKAIYRNRRSKVNEEKVEEKKPNINEQKNNDKNNIVSNQVKIAYKYNRNKIRPNKTDEDLPLKKEREKEEIKVEEKKRRTLATSYAPGSRNILEEKLKQRTYDRKTDDKKIDDRKIDDRKIDDKKIDDKKIDDRKIEETKIDDKKNEIDKKMDTNNNSNYKYKAPNNRKIMILEEKIEEKIEEKPTEENRNETEQNEKINRLKVALNEIEKVNAERTLKNDLEELFEKVLEHNKDFKNNIFFKNLNDTERKVGNMDNKKIPHTYKEIETSKILRNYETAKDLMKKYSQRAKRIVEEN